MKVWWMLKDNNFGDMLTPYLLDYFSIKYEYAPLENADTICIGSIVRRAKDHVNVLGSGIMFLKEKLNPNAVYHFVRGPYTRQKVLDSGGICPKIYGDPALLLPLFCDESKKIYDVGIVPHFVDYNLAKKKYPKYKIINVVNENPLEVAKEITKCRSIISSSLHGIVAAHAYGIPVAWVKFSNKIKGDDIKFKDHYESVGLEPILSSMKKPKFSSISLGCLKIDPIIDIFKMFQHL